MLVVVFDLNLDNHNAAVEEPFIQSHSWDGSVVDKGLSSCEYREFERVFEQAIEEQAFLQAFQQAFRQAFRQASGQAFEQAFQ